MTETRGCSECGKALNRYTPGGRCGSCAWEARARVGEPPTLPEHFWTDPPMRDALHRRDLHAVLRIYLEVTGLTQEAVALLINSYQGTVSKIFSGRRSRYTIEDIESFRDGLHIPGRMLGLQPGYHERVAGTTVDARTVPARKDDPTKRRDFNRSVLLTAVGISGVTGDAFTSADPPRYIGMEHVRMLEHARAKLITQDSLVGGENLFEVARWLYERGRQWLHHSSHSFEVDEALQSVVGELASETGWLAYDADRQDVARHHLQEALLLARMNNDHPLEIEALSTMCMQSVQVKRPREALQLAKTARRIADGWATPRLLALLHLRAARAYAAMSNDTAFRRELAQARSQFERGTHYDDPLFIDFVTDNEVASITARCQLDLHNPDRASTLFRSITEQPDPGFRRNESLRTIGLAEARFSAGDVTEAATIGVDSVPVASTLGSARIRRRLRGLRNNVEPHMKAVPKARDFVESHDVAFGRKRSPA